MAKKRTKYLSPINDLVLRRCLTSHKGVLLLLINGFLQTAEPASDAIVLNLDEADLPHVPATLAKRWRQSSDKLRLKDTSIPPDKPHGKSAVLDILTKLDSGENVNIEMQSTPQSGFRYRMLYYWSLSYSQDIDRGDKFSKLHPTYSLIFTNFTVFKGKHKHITVMELTDRSETEPDVAMPMKLMVVELNKFKKSYRKLVDMSDRWCYIMKHAMTLTAEQEAYLLQDGNTRMILEHLEEISKDDQLYWEALRRKKERVAIQLERRGAFEEGMQESRTQGMQESRTQGMQEGRT